MTIYTQTTFLNKLRMVNYSINPTSNISSTRSANGQLWTAQSGHRIWQGSISCGEHNFQTNNALETLISQVQTPGNFFIFIPKMNRFPANYTGSGLTSVTVDGVQSTGYNLKIKGLPASFKLMTGDFLSYAINGAYRLNRVGADSTATATGTTTVKLELPLTVGALPDADLAIQLVDPRLTAQIVPGSIGYGSAGLVSHSGLSFNFVQALRVA